MVAHKGNRCPNWDEVWEKGSAGGMIFTQVVKPKGFFFYIQS